MGISISEFTVNGEIVVNVGVVDKLRKTMNDRR